MPTTLPAGASRIAMPTETVLEEVAVRAQLVARDLQETINYAFVEAELLARWQLDHDLVPLANPLSAELAVMRPALLPGLVATLGRNVARQIGRVRLFELGKVFAAAGPGEAPVETLRVAAAVCGDAAALQWGLPARKVDFHDLKGDLESLAAASGAVLEFRPSNRPHGHPGRSAEVFRDGQPVGWIGQLHPALARALDIDVDVFAFELALAPLAGRALPRAGELSRFPSVRRDLAFLVPEQVGWAELAATVRITFLRANGSTVVKTFTVNPTSRFNVHVNSAAPELANETFGALVEVTSGTGISVERALYSDALGQVWAGGTNALGTRLP